MNRYLVSSILVAVMLAVALPLVTIDLVSGKGHVPLGDVQVCHKGEAKNIQATALDGHQAHGDIQLPACNGSIAFPVGGDCTGVTDADGDGKADLKGKEKNDQVVTGACPAGTF